MKITFITMCVPSTKRGSSVRIYNLIKQATRLGNEVDMITLLDEGETTEGLVKELGIRKIVVVPRVYKSFFSHAYSAIFERIPPYLNDYRSSGLSDAVSTYLSENKPDVIQIELLHTFDAIRDVWSALKNSGAKIFLDEHNFEYKAFTESISTFFSIKYLIGLYMSSKILDIEKEAVKFVDHVFVCSEIDKVFISKYISENRITVLPNGVDCDVFKPTSLVNKHSLIFIGGVYYPPNNDALHFYFGSIHPIVKKAIPDVRITLLGGQPNKWLLDMSKSDSGILVPGLVPDVRDYINSARICISPMRKGSGTSLKILEYMGSGKPIVSTDVGIRGIKLREGDILIANEPEEFANAIIKLMKDDNLATSIGLKARKIAEDVYSWEIIGKVMSDKYEKSLK